MPYRVPPNKMSKLGGVGGGVVTLETTRPDFFKDTLDVKDMRMRTHGANTKPEAAYIVTILLIVISAFIFVTVVAWFSLLSLAIQRHHHVPNIDPRTIPAGVWYAGISTVLTLLAVLLFSAMW